MTYSCIVLTFGKKHCLGYSSELVSLSIMKFSRYIVWQMDSVFSTTTEFILHRNIFLVQCWFVD